ncbi:MAG: glycosyltransferase [Ancrocorticia sp.]
MTSVLMYSHDTVGLGHARRNRALAYALARELPQLTGEPVGGLLIAGSPNAARDPLPEGWDWFILPGITHGPDGHTPRNLDAPMDVLCQLRSLAVSAAAATLEPDLFIVDRHPWGIGYELEDALREARDHGAATILGLRDVLDEPAKAAAEWDALGDVAQIAEAFDEIWLYGDPAVHDARTSGELPAILAGKAQATGYLAHGRPVDYGAPGRKPYILTLMGGGSDGHELASMAVRAAVPEGHEHLVIAGPQMPQADVRALQDVAREHGDGRSRVRVERSAPNVPELIADAAAVLSMCGYNTATEILASSTPALIVPRTARRKEQLVRAQALGRADAVDVLRPDQLTPAALTTWLASAVTRRVRRDHIDLDGLHTIAPLAASLLKQRSTNRPKELVHAC